MNKSNRWLTFMTAVMVWALMTAIIFGIGEQLPVVAAAFALGCMGFVVWMIAQPLALLISHMTPRDLYGNPVELVKGRWLFNVMRTVHLSDFWATFRAERTAYREEARRKEVREKYPCLYTCPNCSAKNDHQDVLCKSCGEPVAHEVPPVCRTCGCLTCQCEKHAADKAVTEKPWHGVDINKVNEDVRKTIVAAHMLAALRSILREVTYAVESSDELESTPTTRAVVEIASEAIHKAERGNVVCAEEN